MNNTYNITGHQVTSLNILLPTITDDSSLHSNAGLELSHDVTSLPVILRVRDGSIVQLLINSLFLIPTDQSIHEQDANLPRGWSTGHALQARWTHNDTKVNPIAQTG